MAPNDITQPMKVLSEQVQGSSPRQILLAEDDGGCQKLAICILTKAGYEVDLAENGQQVVEKVKQNSYDLILMDMQMPIMDGVTATMAIRDLGYRTIPIIGLTANAFKHDRDRCFDAGMNDFISKPVAPSKLIETIVHWLSRDTIIPSSSTDETCENATMDQHNVVEEAIHSEENPQGTLFKGQVLVADGSRVNQTLIRTLLNQLGLEVVMVDNRQQAVEAIENTRYDLVFMDMHMPGMDGYDAVRFLRSRSVHTPIIAVTAITKPRDREKHIAAGYSDYLSKPICRPRLVEIIEKYLKPISC